MNIPGGGSLNILEISLKIFDRIVACRSNGKSYRLIRAKQVAFGT